MAYIGVLSRHWPRGNEEVDVKPHSQLLVSHPRFEPSLLQSNDMTGWGRLAKRAFSMETVTCIRVPLELQIR